ncbi:MAG TPA: hypothetical protein VK731_09490 [Candidatus Cybelea sp.]|nr:hypothetical protein [Candidatus Cybelea sp.]
MAGQVADVSNFPNEWAVNTAAQTGGTANVNGQQYNFAGLSNADAANQVSAQTAQALLDIQNNYGPAYIKQRLADLQKSDPQGYAAYQELFNQIQQDATANPNRPMAANLQNQVQSMLANSGQLGPEATREVQNQVRAGQAENGITLGNEPAAQESSALVGASDQLQQAQQQQAENYLGSGISPQDVQYRRIQQSLSNLGAFENGVTPEAQFGQLSGAESQAAPQNPVNYTTPAAMNPGAAAASGLNFSTGLFGEQSQFASQQANPFLAGLTTATNTLSTANKLGYNPWAITPPTPVNGAALNTFNAGGGPVSSGFANAGVSAADTSIDNAATGNFLEGGAF